MRTFPVAVRTDEGREIHVPHPGAGDYATLCGMDGLDPQVGQYGIEICQTPEPITCTACRQLYLGVKAMRGLKFCP